MTGLTDHAVRQAEAEPSPLLYPSLGRRKPDDRRKGERTSLCIVCSDLPPLWKFIPHRQPSSLLPENSLVKAGVVGKAAPHLHDDLIAGKEEYKPCVYNYLI